MRFKNEKYLWYFVLYSANWKYKNVYLIMKKKKKLLDQPQKPISRPYKRKSQINFWSIKKYKAGEKNHLTITKN